MRRAMASDVLAVGSEPEAVPAARRFVVTCLHHWGYDDYADSAALVATELVTNAVLHVGVGIELVVIAEADLVRLEVHDGSRVSPVQGVQGDDGMSGRGLAVVSMMSSRWGVEATDRGKVVWAELRAPDTEPEGSAPESAGSTDAGSDVLDPLAAFSDPFDDLPSADSADEQSGVASERLYTVELGDVPTDLLLAAKAQVESLSRELSLAATGANSGVTPEVPAHLRASSEAVLSEFAEARREMQHQAMEAAAKGQSRTHLALTLPVRAADAAQRYLVALEELDAYARSARLLSLETPPEHRAFRRWYVPALVEALRHAAHGEPPTIPATFERYLIQQAVNLDEPWRIAERAWRLQRVVTTLAGVTTDEQVALTAVREAMAEVGAARGAVILAGDLTTPARLIAGLGVGPDVATASVRDGGDLPWRVVVQTGSPVWIDSRRECEDRFPELLQLLPDLEGACVLPLTTPGLPIGVLGLTFATGQHLDDDQRGFLLGVAAAAGLALQRGQLRRQVAREGERLALLRSAMVTCLTAGAVDELAEVVIDAAVGLLGAQMGALCCLQPDGHTVRVVTIRAADGSSPLTWPPIDLDDPLPAAEAVRDGKPVVVATRAERDARWPHLVGAPPEDDHGLVVLPLSWAGRRLGSLGLAVPAHHRVDDVAADQGLALLTDTCARALDRLLPVG